MTQGLIIVGDILDGLARLAADSVDAVVTDPPYELAFMGKKWDATGVAFRQETWEACLRVLKPGGHLIAFGGGRTHHRMWCAIEDAGFEVRELICYLFGTGFPKSLDVSKQLDLQERTRWLELSKALDNVPEAAILKVWIASSSNAKPAGVTFRKSATGTGTSTPRSDSAPGRVAASVNHAQSRADAIIAELNTYGAPHLWGAENTPSVPADAEATTGALSVLVTNVRSSPESLGATPSSKGSTVLAAAWDLLSGNIEEVTRVAEALRIWSGRKKSSAKAATTVLCATLTDALRRTILRRSATFLSLDTTQRMAVVSATSVTITESMAASLISSMVATLKREAIDKAAGVERKVVGHYTVPEDSDAGNAGKIIRSVTQDGGCFGSTAGKEGTPITAPATDAAKQWEGWGTALKPAVEPILLARKPLPESTVAANVLKWGTGALAIDATRIGVSEGDDISAKNPHTRPKMGSQGVYSSGESDQAYQQSPAGRWPANVIFECTCDEPQPLPEKARKRKGEPSQERRYTEEGATNIAAKPGARREGGGFVHEPDCAAGMLDAQTAQLKGATGRTIRADRRFAPGTMGQEGTAPSENDPVYGDTGGASRFFYCAKASRAERERGLEDFEPITGAEAVNRKPDTAGLKSPRAGAGRSAKQVKNPHPTVKPIALMRWLVRLVTPPGGLVLDPFCGSGSTLIAAREEGHSFVGVDLSAEYCRIAQARVGGAELVEVGLPKDTEPEWEE